MVAYLALISLFVAVVSAQEPPLIKISNGLLQGTFRRSYNGRIFSSFEGIPYARPPIGELRFEAPQEPLDWIGTWIANTIYQCLQSVSTPWTQSTVIGDEDCLYLNVYVPREKITTSDKLNVIVHIHGGAFMVGSSSLYAGPEYLMDEEVILVTMNYRLGPFGFLSTEDDVVPGNNGLKDQFMSLLWIQKNIKFFGGNPDSVTLTGMSAGGASVHFHYFSPLSKGLFHRGFSESGTALDPWAMQKDASGKAKQLAAFVGCPADDSRELVACLKSRSGNEVTQQMSKFSPVSGTPITSFAPVVEKEYNGAFLTKHPYAALLEKTVTDLPWIVSVAEQEGHSFALNFADAFAEFLAKFEEIAPHLLNYNNTIGEDEKPYVSSQIQNHYFQRSAGYEDLGQLIGDRLFLIGADTSAKLQAKGNKSPVYFYILGYKGKHGIGEMFGKHAKNIGASHGDGILYYFKTPISDEKLSDNDEKMKAFFLRWIVSFANNREPKINEVKWQPVTGNEALEHLYIKSPENIRMDRVKDLGSNSFWSQFAFKENKNLFQDMHKSNDEL